MSVKPLLIAFSGKICSGKDESAKFLIGWLGGRRIAFADALKESFADTWSSLTGEPINPWTQKTEPMRDALQRYGMAFRALRESVWVDRALHNADVELKVGNNVYITDCRFVNEADAVIAAGGSVIRLERPVSAREADIQRLYGDISPDRFSHPSETDLDDYKRFSYTLYAANVTQLRERLKHVTQLILTKQLKEETDGSEE